MIEFVEATSKEQLEVIRVLAVEIWNEHYPAIIGQEQVDYMLTTFQTVEKIDEQINEGYVYVLICDADGDLGYCAYRIEEQALFLSKIYVRSVHRKRGVARATMGYLAELAVEHHRQTIYLTVNKYNLDAIHTYEKMGFVKKDEIVVDIGGGFVMDDFVMDVSVDSSLTLGD
ncbi:hypothetical protein BFP72_10980 [Reichenbachiella sp. 5M10]|uniref:GNAT family N-acetyltransferase n=1 Tax=Reichenbachiella sp. 5M10 TaxID=1889772 RepID=UPI000C14E636|nr:GNAT family N-acetyltransferase [Reichenbachiella sp. 5M10]PIB35880.1 hypothetical protein BFP72_10980 [Reichenbachiella sp. 5M10]